MLYSFEHRRLRIRHIAFMAGLLAIFAGSLLMASLSTGPVILGTEMNANGLVEYLCLGTGCEDFTAMRWVD